MKNAKVKKLLGMLCAVTIMMMSVTVGFVGVSAAAESTARATDVYASGNWVVGQTVSANYTYYDATGKAEIENSVEIQWYRTTNFNNPKEAAISGATSKDYVLTDDDAGKNLFFTVKTKNADGAGKLIYSPVYKNIKKADATSTKPEKLSSNIILTGGAQAFNPGVTVRAVHQTAFTNLKAEGETTYTWKLRETPSGDATVCGNDKLYTITEADYGKYLEVVIRPKDVDGANSGDISSIVKIGTKFDVDTTAITTTLFYPTVNNVNRLWYQSQDALYTYNGAITLVADVRKEVRFDGFFFSANRVGSDLEISYSKDNATWTKFDIGTVEAWSAKEDKEYTSANVFKARYFKITYTANGGNSTFSSFYPFLSATNRESEYVDIKSVGYGATFDNNDLVISNIIYGVPVKTLADSIVAYGTNSSISIIDASGNIVENAEEIRLVTNNAADYSIKVACGEKFSQVYTLNLAPAIHKNDFSAMKDGVKYMSVKGQTRDIPGTTSYWTATADHTEATAPYGIKEVMADGTTAAKIVTNGNLDTNAVIVNIWTVLRNLSEDGCYSFAFKAKPGANTHMGVHARAGALNGPLFDRQSVKFASNNGVSASNGSGFKYIADYDDNIWHDVEFVVDYKNNTQSMWVDGINCGMNIPFSLSGSNLDKTTLSVALAFNVAADGTNDESYIKDIEVNKVWDVTTKKSADGENIDVELYDSENKVAEALVPGETYTAKANGKLFGNNYCAAVYSAEYADNEQNEILGTQLLDVISVEGSENVEINNISVPAEYYSNYESGNLKTGVIVKLFIFNSEIVPVSNCKVIK